MSSSGDAAERIVVDSIHGDIHLNEQEWRVVDTATFQRLRYIKQLGMAHFTYPNATHTRFAHSLGCLGVMRRILQVSERRKVEWIKPHEQDLRLAALLHDVGHYPYSHLMETVDAIQLMEEIAADAGGSRRVGPSSYPNHDALGPLIVSGQADLVDALGGSQRATRIGNWLSGKSVPNAQLRNLISSSLDMDRMDYLLRDSRATGVPYGQVDINYLLNSLEISPSGVVGLSEKALPAAEHFLFARYFMHRAVYFHKTTYAFEEATRQLLRRIRDTKAKEYGLPADGQAVEQLATSPELQSFTDAFVDNIVQRATQDTDPCIKALATAIRTRRPPKLLRQVAVLEKRDERVHPGTAFKQNCKFKIGKLADENGLPLGQFIFCSTRPLSLEKRGASLTIEQAKSLAGEEHDELIKVFVNGKDEPQSIVDLEHTLVNHCAGRVFQMFRLYVVCDDDKKDELVAKLRDAVRDW